MTDYPDDVHSNGANWSALLEVVNMATRTRRSVDVMYVEGDISGAVSRTVSRCKADFRVVPMETQAFLHRAAPSNFLKAAAEIKQDGVGFVAYDSRVQCFTQDFTAPAIADLNDPNNNPAWRLPSMSTNSNRLPKDPSSHPRKTNVDYSKSDTPEAKALYMKLVEDYPNEVATNRALLRGEPLPSTLDKKDEKKK